MRCCRAISLFLVLFVFACAPSTTTDSKTRIAPNPTIPVPGPAEPIPNGPHPRIWLTPSLISTFKAKKAANTLDWQNLLARCSVFSSYNNDAETGKLDWPGGAGYAGSGYLDALVSWGLAYYTYKTSTYGTANETADDLSAKSYAAQAVSLLNAMVTKFSPGEEQDGIEMVRMNDRRYIFNKDEYAIEAARPLARLLTYKNGYAARTTAKALPIAFDWFYNDLPPLLRTTLYKIMFRHIDWFRGIRSAYNNGILIDGIRYHEDTNGDCTGINNCNINDTSDHLARRQLGYSYGKIGANFYESFVGTAMLIPVAVYGDAPDADAVAYLTYARQLLSDHLSSMSSPVGWKGGDSTEGVYYFSSWKDTLGGMLGLESSMNLGLFSGFEFPKEMALNLIHNTYSSLNRMIHRGAWSSSNPSYWMIPNPESILPTAFILRNYYGEPEEAKLLQSYLTSIVTLNKPLAWQEFLWRNDLSSASKPITTLPLYYHAIGTGIVSMRSSWNNAFDTVVAQISLKGTNRLDHESFDDGHILLSRGEDKLLSRLKYASGADEEASIGQNTVVFNEQSSLPTPISDPNYIKPLTRPAIDQIENSDAYLYVRGEVSNSWKYNPALWPGRQDLARLFYRTLLYLRPGTLVIHDITRSNSTVGNLKSWYLQLESAPVIDAAAGLVSATVGSSSISVKRIYPSGGTYSTTSPQNGFYRVKYAPAVTQEYDQFLHVVEATASNEVPAAATAISVTTGSIIGAQTKTSIALFTSNPDGSAPGSFGYQYSTAPLTTHYLGSLTPGTRYQISAFGDTVVAAPAPEGEFVVSDNGLIVLTVSSDGNVVQAN